LEPEFAAALERLARRRGTSRAELIRQAARRLLSEEQPVEPDPVLGILGLGHGGPGGYPKSTIGCWSSISVALTRDEVGRLRRYVGLVRAGRRRLTPRGGGSLSCVVKRR